MSQVSLNLGLTGSNDVKISKAITDVNPNATDAELYAFAQLANGLTTNNLAKITRIEKHEVENVTRYDLTFVRQSTTFVDGVAEVKLSLAQQTGTVFFKPFINNEAGDNSDYAFHFINELSVKYKPTEIGTMSIAFGEQSHNGSVDVYVFTEDMRSDEENAQYIGTEAYIIIPDGSVEINGTTYYYNGTTLTVRIVADS